MIINPQLINQIKDYFSNIYHLEQTKSFLSRHNTDSEETLYYNVMKELLTDLKLLNKDLREIVDNNNKEIDNLKRENEET